MVGIGDCIQVPMTSSLIQTSVKNGFALLLNSLRLPYRTEGVENIAFHHHTFPQAILWARGRVSWTSLILKQVVSSKLLYFVWCYITHCYFSLIAVFSPTSNSSESYWSSWVIWEISHQILSFQQKYGKLAFIWNCIIWPCGKQCLLLPFQMNCCFE